MDFEVRHIDGTTVKLISSEHKCAITSATQTRKLCGNDTVTINLQSATYIEFQVGDKITIFGTTYTLNQLPTVKKESERSYSYTLVFEGLQYTLIDRVFLMPANTQGDNLMFDLAGMLRELATNINRGNSGKQYEFVLDNSLEETEYKNLSLTGKNCLQVLQQLCQEWDTEFVFAEEPNRIAIYIGVAGSTFPTTFKYGRGGGVYELNREKGASDICTRLFVYGGTQNLTYYRHNRLCLPSKEKNQSYVEDATAQAVYGIKEQVKNFDDIYPNRIGTITSLSGCDYNEFIDSEMADAEFGFDLNEKWANNADDCAEWIALKGLENTEANRTIYYNDVAGTATKYLMAGATAKIHFNTGALAGYECDLHSYTHSSQKFVLKPLVDENGYDFPSKTNAAFKLAVGDEYVILDINLPTAYKEEAESKLATEAASYFDTVCRPQPKYTLTIEPIALKHIVGPSTADTEIFKVGDLINISDPTGGVESATIRIDQFVRNLLDPFDYKLTLTDEITYSQQVRTLIEVDAIKRVVEESKIYDVNRIRRGWKDAEELYNQMFDTEGHYYSEKIAPLSIDTQMLKVGARSQQLVLQNVLFQPNYNANPANLEISAGSLVHYTIAEPDIKTWTMSALSASNVPSAAQYVYAKCAKNGTTCTWLVTDQAIIFDSDASYYHFLVGSLSSVDSVSNTRNFAATYGFTTINGRNITTGVIKSSDGSSVVIDLDAGIIKGNITFESGTTSYNALQSIIGNNTTVQSAATTANTANATANRAEGKIDGLEIGGRNLIPNTATATRIPTNGTATNNFTVKTYQILGQPFRLNDNITLSADITTNEGSITKVTAIIYNSAITTNYQRLGDINVVNGQLCITVKVNSTWADKTDAVLLLYAGVAGATLGNAITVSKLKLEKGNKATDWTPAPEDTEAELTALQTELQGQIDSKIETWSQSADPSTAWTTTALKDKHEGDLWQYTGTTTSTRTHNATYRWSGSAWVEQKASSELFDKIDGKAAIFYNSTASGYTPTGVQDGDFLLLNDGSGKSYRWKVEQGVGSWVPIQDYQTPIATLNNTLSARINNITDNGIISGGKEKYQLKGEWIEIAGSNGAGTADGSYYTIKQKASPISGSTQSLDTAFSALKAKMDIILTSMSTDTTLDDLSLDADSFNALWKAYYDAETALENTIQSFYDDRIRRNLQATCATAEGTQAKVITCAEWKDSFFTTDTKLFVRFDNANTNQHPLISVNGKLGFIRYNNTLSGYRFPEYDDTTAPMWLGESVIQLEYAGTGHAEWTDGQGQTQRYPASGDYHIWQMPDEGAFKSSQVLQRSIKGQTDIIGGLILTETIALRNAQGVETAGMTGITEANDVAMYAGDLRSAQNGTASVIIKKTGDAKFGAVKINGSGNGEMIMDSGGVRRLSIKNEPLKLEEQGVTYNAANNHNDNSPTSGTALSGGSVTTAEKTHNIFDYGMILSPAHQYVFDVHLSINKVTIAVTTAGGAGYITAVLEFYNGSEWAYVDSWELYNGQVRTYEKNSLSYLMRYANPTGYAYMGLRLRYKTDASSAGTATVSLSAPKWYYYCDQNKANMQIANDGMCYYLNSANQFAVKTNNDQSLTIKARGEIDIPGVLWAGEVKQSGTFTAQFNNSAVTVSSNGTTPSDTSLYNFKYTGISGTPIIIATPRVAADGYGWTAMVESLSTTNKTFSVRVKRDNAKYAADFHLVILGTT